MKIATFKPTSTAKDLWTSTTSIVFQTRRQEIDTKRVISEEFTPTPKRLVKNGYSIKGSSSHVSLDQNLRPAVTLLSSQSSYIAIDFNG